MKKAFLTLLLAASASTAFAQAVSPLQTLLRSSVLRLDDIKIEVPAAPAAPAAENKCPGWKVVLKKVLEHGLFTEADPPYIPAGKGLADLSAPKDEPHTASYINAWGYVTPEGVFEPSYVTMVYEDWARNGEGNWHIGQWLISLDLNGTITRVSRGYLVETADGQVLDMHSEQLDPAGPEAAAEREALLRKWEAYTPPPGK